MLFTPDCKAFLGLGLSPVFLTLHSLPALGTGFPGRFAKDTPFADIPFAVITQSLCLENPKSPLKAAGSDSSPGAGAAQAQPPGVRMTESLTPHLRLVRSSFGNPIFGAEAQEGSTGMGSHCPAFSHPEFATRPGPPNPTR